MTKQELINLYNGLNSVSNLVGQKFGYIVGRNLKILKPEIDKIREGQDLIIENFGTPNEKGVKELKFSNEEWVKFLKEEVSVELFKIKLDEIPKEATAGQISGIFEIIEE